MKVYDDHGVHCQAFRSGESGYAEAFRAVARTMTLATKVKEFCENGKVCFFTIQKEVWIAKVKT
jgi:hypothetical protein